MDKVLMPKELTAENGAKYALIGEFHETHKIVCCECWAEEGDPLDECELCDGNGEYTEKVQVSWTTIKNIYKKSVDIFGSNPARE